MPKAQMNWLRRKAKRVYAGDETAWGLVHWLNMAAHSKAKERVIRLLQTLNDLRRAEEEGQSESSHYRDLMLRFGEQISEYHLTPSVVGIRRGDSWSWGIKWQPPRGEFIQLPRRPGGGLTRFGA